MLYDKRILTVVPARGGSKGVKLKNIQPILGIPLIGYTGKIITHSLKDKFIHCYGNQEDLLNLHGLNDNKIYKQNNNISCIKTQTWAHSQYANMQ